MHSSGGWSSQIKASAAFVPTEDCEEESVYAAYGASGGLLTLCGVSWPVEASPQSWLSPCVPVSLQISPFCQDTSHIGAGRILITHLN